MGQVLEQVRFQGKDPLTGVEDLVEVGWPVEVDGGGCLKEIESGRV